MLKRLFSKLYSLGDPGWGKTPSKKGDTSSKDSNSDLNGSNSKNSGEKNDGDKSSENDGRSQPRGRDENPPDLEEVWKDFNKKLGSLFGNAGRSGGSRPGNNWGGNRNNGSGGGGLPPINFNAKTASIGGVILASVWLASGFYIVEEGQTALVLRFGEYKYSASAGFNWRFPFPIDSHETVNFAQLRQTTVGVRNNQTSTSGRDSLMLTRDENIVDVQFAVQYRVGNPEAYVFNNLRPDDIVRQAAETAMREVVGRSLADAVLYENKEAISREALKITQEISDRYDSGLTIVNLTIQNVQPPEEVQAAFSDAIKAAQDAEKTKNEGQAYANDIIPRARGAAFRLVEEAQGYREKVVATAEGDSQRFMKLVAEYKNAPEITRQRLYLESMQEVFSNVSKVMIETKSGSNLLYLPLDKLIQRSMNSSSNSSTGDNTINESQRGTSTSRAVDAVRDAIGNNRSGGTLRDRLREVR
ncbi:MAG: HflK protein [Betaproteobacteria bacterium TMED156]|nr:MAG: HflK protein [Betaproteobacteria bacterium TMED156]